MIGREGRGPTNSNFWALNANAAVKPISPLVTSETVGFAHEVSLEFEPRDDAVRVGRSCPLLIDRGLFRTDYCATSTC